MTGGPWRTSCVAVPIGGTPSLQTGMAPSDPTYRYRSPLPRSAFPHVLFPVTLYVSSSSGVWHTCTNCIHFHIQPFCFCLLSVSLCHALVHLQMACHEHSAVLLPLCLHYGRLTQSVHADTAATLHANPHGMAQCETYTGQETGLQQMRIRCTVINCYYFSITSKVPVLPCLLTNCFVLSSRARQSLIW